MEFGFLESRFNASEMDMVKRAYAVAEKAHATQRRKSGEPYIVHPVAVARIVGEELELGPEVVCAAFLHDVVEDTPYTIKEVEENFGPEVAFLVEAVTKKKKTNYETSKQVDNFMHMLDSVDHTLNALLLKLADRLHNMRTLDSMPPAKQMKIAGETDFFYAPLALRLGLYNVKTELENLSFKYRCPRDYWQLDELLKKEKEHIMPFLEEFRDAVAGKLDEIGIKAEIKLITRRPYSIHKKMEKKNADFQHLQRIHSVHVIYEPIEGESEKQTALRIYEQLTNVHKEKPHSVTNYIDNPKENGYQSLHVHLLAGNGHWQEVRISSRRMARVQTMGCIANCNEEKIAGWLYKLKETIKDMHLHPCGIGFMQGVRAAFYNDDLLAYPLEGEAIRLPENASALDFAFELLGEEALHAQYAHINGKLASLTTPLIRGDIVDVRTNPVVTPQPHWINHVLTYKAQRYLREWEMSQSKPLLVRCSHCQPLPGHEVIGFKQPDGPTMVHKRDCPVVIGQASQHGDQVVSVDFVEDGTPYMVHFKIGAVDRYGLLIDIIKCITEKLGLSIDALHTTTNEHIVECKVDFCVYSFAQLDKAITELNAVPGVEEVTRAV